MNKYIIYKIYQEKNPDICYIGITNNFSKRKSSHKKYSKCRTSKKYHYPLYKYIRACGGWEAFKMDIIEECQCKTRDEILERETEMISLYNAKLNGNKTK